ncbi:MAG: hypothetical protein HFF57_03655 [Lawsonibacter sp.]|nr:hypothetical protein [Lawsonibacter sp.]
MTDYERLYTGLSHAAWGYFLLHFNFNLNVDSTSINILPSFAGALLLLSAVDKLSAERRDLKLLRPLCMILAAWHLADWLLALAGTSLTGKILFLDLIFTAVLLYFHFQFLTDMAAIAEKYQPEEETLNRRILRRRTVLLVLATIADVASGLFQAADLGQMMKMEMPFGLLTIALGVLLAVTLIVIVMIMFSLFQLRRYVRNWGEAEPPFPAE